MVWSGRVGRYILRPITFGWHIRTIGLAFLYDMCFATLREWDHRNLVYEVEPPKRQTLILHPEAEVNRKFIEKVMMDYELGRQLQAISEG